MEETIEKKVREALDSQAVIIPGFFEELHMFLNGAKLILEDGKND